MLRVEEVTMKYDGRTILNQYSSSFEKGKIHVIMGQSGCGKTTLLRIIAGLQKPTSGKVYIDDVQIKKPSGQIFMMHQHYTNFGWKTCLENILFPLSIKKRVTQEDVLEAEQILEVVGLSNYKDKYPSELSGGMNQRLAFARTIMAKPEIILMDEPMSALDNTTRRTMQDLLKTLNTQTKNTIIIVTHSEQEAQYMANNLIRM